MLAHLGRRLLPTLLVLCVPSGAAAAATPESKVTDPVPLLELVAPGGSGRLYTLSTSEAASAASGHGMALQPRRIGYLRRQAFDGSVPLYRLRAVGRLAYLVTPSAEERAALVASGAFASEGTMGYIAKDQAPATERLWRFTNGHEWRVAFESERAALVGAGYTVDGPLGYAPRRSIRAGAIYFGTWNGGTRNVIDGTARVFGRQEDHWGGVRDYSGMDPSVPVFRGPWANEDFSHLKPAIGFYDDSRPETVAKHITQASSAGLDHFAFYWYWDSNVGRETLDRGLGAFLQAPNRAALDFGLTICAHTWENGRLTIPVSQYGAVTELLVDRYLSQPNYLRANDGRKVLWLCDTRGIGSGSNADVRAFVDGIRTRAAQRLGESVVVLAHQDLGLDEAAAGADGEYCVAPYGAVSGGSYSAYVAGQRAGFASGPPVFMRCAMSDFDERPRYPILVPNVADIRWFPDQSRELFAQAIRNVRDDIDASTRSPVVDNFALLYSWNEHHEGGHVVQPSAVEGCAYLDIVRAGWQLTSGNGCIAVPADPPGPSPPPAPPPSAAPTTLTLSGFKATRTRFRVAPRRAAQSAKHRVRRGTTFQFRMSHAARVTIDLRKRRSGVRVGRRCVKPDKRRQASRKRACDLPVGTLRRQGRAGLNRVGFSGRIGRRALRAGRYVAVAQARNATGTSKAQRASFRVVR
ncbi:MAG TPA: glycoside hydrolase family 99-like domain-containing protein [Conexibacter sp.]|nr:glycoside hydrolase family 99-like domain-containing protein [Conexibacter sp.]